MTHILAGLAMAMLVAVAGQTAHAEETAANVLKTEQAIRANILPLSPAYVSSSCLLPYPVCKLTFAAVSLVAGWEQLILGGDVQGATNAIERGLTGPWLVHPRNVSGDWQWSLPEPLPLISYFATGKSNEGDVAINPLPSLKRPALEGDVLPP